MAKEIYLYTGLYNYSAKELMEAVTEVMGKECVVLENCYGGDVFATMGIQAKFKEHGNVTVKVYGAAFSGGFNILMYAKKVVALSTARFLIHRADGYASTPEQKALLDSMNKDLRAQIAKRVDESKLITLKGVSMDAIFNPETRIDLFLTASEMKQLGLVDEIIELSPQEMQAQEELMFRIAANYPAPTQEKPQTENNKPSLVMNTLAEFKEKHPALYAEALAEGVKEGKRKELDRVNSVMVFAHLDPEGAKKIITSGEPMTETQRSEFALKAMSPEAILNIKKENPAGVKTDTKIIATATTEKDAEVSAFEQSLKQELGLVKSETKAGVTLVQLT